VQCNNQFIANLLINTSQNLSAFDKVMIQTCWLTFCMTLYSLCVSVYSLCVSLYVPIVMV